MKATRCFITGGAGFIGSHLVDRLLAEGNDVTVFDNLSSGKEDFITAHKENPRFRFIVGELLDLDTLLAVNKDHETVFHLAANPDARRGITDTALDLRLETLVTYNVLESMRRNGIKKLVFPSSGTIYGETPSVPIAEDYGPVLPISLYGAGKLASEGLISAFCHTFDIQAWIFRLANIVGRRATHGVIFDFTRSLEKNPEELQILGDGTQCKPYLHVSECIDGMLYGLRNAPDRLNVYNLGTSTVTDVNTIARTIVAELGRNGVSFRYTGGDRGWPGDVPQFRYDISKMKRLGWKARLTSDEAVRKAVKEIINDSKYAQVKK
jgi:UDP-glucose 4-epimerase